MRRAFFGFVATWGLISFSFGATLTVDLNGGADYTDIQAAIDAAADGDTVLVKPGEYVITEPIDFKGKAVAVRSAGGAGVMTIRMAGMPANPDTASEVIFRNEETNAWVLEGLTATGGRAAACPALATLRPCLLITRSRGTAPVSAAACSTGAAYLRRTSQ